VEILTATDRVAALTDHIKANHTYDVPEIIATPITGGSVEFLAWLVDETRDAVLGGSELCWRRSGWIVIIVRVSSGMALSPQ